MIRLAFGLQVGRPWSHHGRPALYVYDGNIDHDN
jgi:hypothetical protein